jgi:hypothetical protein
MKTCLLRSQIILSVPVIIGLFFISTFVWLESAKADFSWPKSLKGEVVYSRRSKPHGKCEASVTTVIDSDGVKQMDILFKNCETYSRTRFDLPVPASLDGWKWDKGIGYANGKLAGSITNKKIALNIKFDGIQIHMKKNHDGRIWFDWEFEHNESTIGMSGLLSAESVVLKDGEK